MRHWLLEGATGSLVSLAGSARAAILPRLAKTRLMTALSEPRFGKYELIERIGAGGMAEVYRARMTGPAGVTLPVVIKKIHPQYAGNESFLTMFVNEARICAGLSHGNIAHVVDFGEVDGELYLAMELVHGQPVSKVLRAARQNGMPALPAPLAALLVMEVCKGLHYAHSRVDEKGEPLNIVHRDVSPPNVMVSYEGQVKLVDFGIAKARHAAAPQTQAGALKGKYTYFAPEQVRGKDIDARTDVFAAGAVLYQMLCGRLPFQGKMIDVLTKILHGDFPAPRLVNPDVPPALEAVVLTAMASQKEKRYPTAAAMEQALAAYLHAEAPATNATTLSQLLLYLFRDDLAAEGRQVQLPPEFYAKLSSWQKKPEPEGTVAAGRARRTFQLPQSPPPLPQSLGSDLELTPTDREQDPRRDRLTPAKRRLLLAVAPTVAVALSALLWLAFDRGGTFTLELSSTPPGARVILDGRVYEAFTPTRVVVSAAHEHRVDLASAGMKPWSRQLSSIRGAVVRLHAELEPQHAPPRSPTEKDAAPANAGSRGRRRK